MFKKLANLFRRFFGSLFGKRPDPTPPPRKVQFAEDASDVPIDSVIVTPIDPAIGPFADPDKEAAIDAPPTGDDGTTQPEPSPPPPDDGGGQPQPDPTPPAPVHTPRFMWCLDNGHGKLQPGKRSPVFELDGKQVQFFEYEFNRDIVVRITKALDERGVRYFEVVPEVEEVGSFLEERVKRVNELQSDLPKLFVSVHSNAGPAGADGWVADSIRGVETWHAHGSVKGKHMAMVFQRHLVATTGLRDRGIKTTKEKNLYVLVKTIPPAILTENGFFNNKLEVLELMKDSVRQKIADAHVAAIMEIEENGFPE